MAEISIQKITPAFVDDRGTITDILQSDDIRHVGIITSKAGSVRGKHYHKKATQYVYVLDGKIELITKDLEKDTRTNSVTIVTGDLATIPPRVWHLMRALEESAFLVFSTEPRLEGGYENDTFRVEL